MNPPHTVIMDEIMIPFLKKPADAYIETIKKLTNIINDDRAKIVIGCASVIVYIFPLFI